MRGRPPCLVSRPAAPRRLLRGGWQPYTHPPTRCGQVWGAPLRTVHRCRARALVARLPQETRSCRGGASRTSDGKQRLARSRAQPARHENHAPGSAIRREDITRRLQAYLKPAQLRATSCPVSDSWCPARSCRRPSRSTRTSSCSLLDQDPRATSRAAEPRSSPHPVGTVLSRVAFGILDPMGSRHSSLWWMGRSGAAVSRRMNLGPSPTHWPTPHSARSFPPFVRCPVRAEKGRLMRLVRVSSPSWQSIMTVASASTCGAPSPAAGTAALRDVPRRHHCRRQAAFRLARGQRIRPPTLQRRHRHAQLARDRINVHALRRQLS